MGFSRNESDAVDTEIRGVRLPEPLNEGLSGRANGSSELCRRLLPVSRGKNDLLR